MKINLIEFLDPISAANVLGDMLNAYGQTAHINAMPLNYYDVSLVLFATCLNKKLFREPHPPIVVMCAGQDVWRDYIEKPYSNLLAKCDLVLYCDPTMENYTGIKGIPWHTPMSFEYPPSFHRPERDTLIYCQDPITYRMDKVCEYIESHPDEKITVLGTCYTATILEPHENVLAIPRIPTNSMPYLLENHKKFMIWLKWVTAPPAARLGCEALSMGLKVFCNDMPVTEIPDYMWQNVAIPKLIKLLEGVIKNDTYRN